MVCFYLRLLSHENDVDKEISIVDWYRKYKLNDVQTNCLKELGEALQSRGVGNPVILQRIFHQVLMSLFCWHETGKLLEECDCPVQRFLMIICLRQDGKGFINARDVSPWISKLIYGIRCTVWTELMNGSDEGIWEEKIKDLKIYVKEQVQSPFGFLCETKHLAFTIVGETNALPQVAWLGEMDYNVLAIHGKRIEFSKLGMFCQSLLKKAKRFMDCELKMGIRGLRNVSWKEFSPLDNLANVKEGYCFLDGSLKDQAMSLLDNFLRNESTRSFFTDGIKRGHVSWKRGNCLSWLKKSRTFLEMLMVLSHLLGGQPARSTEMATLRWRNAIEIQRGVYWSNGTVMLLGIYSKLRGMTNRDRMIPRYNLLYHLKLTIDFWLRNLDI